MATERPAQGKDGQAQLTVRREGDGVAVQGPLFAEVEGAWTAVQLDDKRILLMTEDAKMNSEHAGVATCPVTVFKDFLVGLHNAAWSGVVSVDTDYGVKKIYFSKGDVVFAGSNVIDDRLGEVIFREARITLDELTNSAAQVTKQRKFGQVLLTSGIFTNVQLWDALKLQVRQILRSVFMVDKVYFELATGPAPTEVSFPESTEELMNDCASFGSAFRAFLAKLRAESRAELLTDKDRAEFAPGTFVGDLMAMIEQYRNVQELLNASKLLDPYTVAALLNLVNQGLCKVTPDVDEGRKMPPSMAPLKAKIDAYSYVLQAVRKAFADSSKDFPLADMRQFAASLNPVGFPSLFVDAQASLGRDCVSSMISQCTANAARVGYFAVRIEGMIQFLLQVAGDNLAFPVAKQIRQDYRTISA